MKKTLALWVLVLFIFCSNMALPLSKESSQQERVIIPKEVGTVFDQGVTTKTPNTDIPIKFLQYFYFPAQQNHLHTIFLFKMKNQDLDFQEMKQETSQKESSQEENPLELVADLNAFLRFYKIEKGNVIGIFKEVYIPVQIKKKKKDFNPEEENFYSVGYPLPPGNYLLAMAVTSVSLTKIGTFYTEFELPNPLNLKNELILTPIVFLKSYKELPTPETMPNVHLNSFRYSILSIVPRLNLVFSNTEQPDVFYYIFGVKTNPETKKFEIEISYRILKGKEEVIKFKPAIFEFPLISHPLPLKIKDKFIEPGEYTLEIKIVDKVSNASVTKKINFKYI